MTSLLIVLALILPAVMQATTYDASVISDLLQRVDALEQADRYKTKEIHDDKILINKLVSDLSKIKALLESQIKTLAKTNVILLEQHVELSRLKAEMAAQDNRIKELGGLLQGDSKHIDDMTDTTGDLNRVESKRSASHSHGLLSHANKTASEFLVQTQGQQETYRNNNVRKGKKLANNPIRSIAEQGVAFHATIDKYGISHICIGQKIVYDVVLLNRGNGYHGQHGLFIAPQAGVYLFATSIIDWTHYEVRVSLMKNGEVMGRALADPVTPGPNSQGSVTAIVELAVGDEVWVELLSNPDTTYYGDRFTTFCGVLIYSV